MARRRQMTSRGCGKAGRAIISGLGARATRLRQEAGLPAADGIGVPRPREWRSMGGGLEAGVYAGRAHERRIDRLRHRLAADFDARAAKTRASLAARDRKSRRDERCRVHRRALARTSHWQGVSENRTSGKDLRAEPDARRLPCLILENCVRRSLRWEALSTCIHGNDPP